MRRAVFLDRDGTLNEAVVDRPWLPDKKVTAPFTLEEVRLVPHLYEAMGLIEEAGYMKIGVTNQPDVANGYLTEAVWRQIHNKVMRAADLDFCFMCRHPRWEECFLRKPNPGMLLAAADVFDINLKESFMVGDTDNDTLAGKAAGCRTILIRWPYNTGVKADFVVDSLLEAAKLIASQNP